jgi:hypothetical protein
MSCYCLYWVFQEASMVPRNVFIAIICTTLLMWSGLSVADEYQPDQFLGLDLSQAVLSPKPLGPAAHFAPVAVEARTDLGSDARPVRVVRVTHPKTRAAHLRAEKPRGAARNRLARRHGNPLDAQAFDTRVQVWPCKSGGICNWKR